MMKNLGRRFALIGVVVVLALWYLYPTVRWATLDKSEHVALVEEYRRYDAEHPRPTFSETLQTYLYRWFKGDKSKAVNLGLDLQGGMHLVLEVDSEAATTNELVRMKDDLRRRFVEGRIVVGAMSVENHRIVIPVTASSMEDVEKAIKDYSSDLILVPERDRLLVSMPDDRMSYYEGMSVRQALETIRNRIDEFGVAEPVIQREGDDRVLVQLPGIEDPERVIDLLGKTAQLRFHIVVDYAEGTNAREQLLAKYDQRIPQNTFVAPLRGLNRSGRPVAYLLEKEARVTGADLVDARLTRDELGSPAVAFQLDRAGARQFGALTEANINKQLAIVLDNVVESAPVIQSVIHANGQITGQFTVTEAEDLAIVLRSGALPAPVKIIEQRTVGPTLGIESIQYGFRAAVISLVIVCVFMVVYYRAAGLIADLALVLNLVVLVAFLAYFRATLTLPGIGGIILTIGMAVDANVLVFERIREEIRKKKTLRSAVDTGYAKALWTILDANITTLITAVVLFQFGTGPVKGFAVTLSAGIIISMFTALFVTRAIFDLLIQRKWLTRLNMLHVLTDPSVRFVTRRYVGITASIILIAIGMGTFLIRGNDNLGIDFAQGTIVQVRFEHPITTGEVRDALNRAGIGETIVQQYGSPTDVLIRTSVESNGAAGQEDTGGAVLVGEKIAEALRTNLSTPFEVERTEEVGAAVSKDLTQKALLAILYSTIGIIIYISLRFEFRFAIGAVLALFHDVFITMGALAVTGREIQLPVVAALLTIFGYSINDTIVVFDRIRENMRMKRGMDFLKVVDASINETLSRTILTALTTIFAVTVLYFVGGTVTRDFAFALIVGIATGTYSSIFIASPTLVIWQQVFSRKRFGTGRAKAEQKEKPADV
jgi:SecD/SecF fusion protein